MRALRTTSDACFPRRCVTLCTPPRVPPAQLLRVAARNVHQEAAGHRRRSQGGGHRADHAPGQHLCDGGHITGAAARHPPPDVHGRSPPLRVHPCTQIEVPDSYLAESTPAAPTMTRDWALCRYLTIEHGVTAIPPSAFYSAPNKVRARAPAVGPHIRGSPSHRTPYLRARWQHHAGSTARFAMCKTDDSLATAVQALRRIGERTGSGSGSA